jgi:sugar phosphate isomerase/epimerase
VKVGVLTVVHHDRLLPDVLDRLAELDVEAVELGTGNYPGSAHADPDVLLAEPARAAELRRAVEERGMVIGALSCHGNPLHPDPDVAKRAHSVWEKTARLAELLEVGVVNGFSGCPGTPDGGGFPNWVSCAWPPEYRELLTWQWDEVAIPYWIRQAELARRHGIRIGLEMHPGFLVYNPETLLRLRGHAGEEIGANFDPSHLVWQGIDPVAAIGALGRGRAIVHAHAKDTFIDHGNVRVNGVLDTKSYTEVRDRAWTFRTIGYGQSEKVWRDIVSALRVAGYDHVLSIEHEDSLLSRDEGLARAVELLRRVVPREPPAEPWWT